MAPLKFVYKQENETDAKPVNEKKKMVNELQVSANLAPYLEEINESGAHILVIVDEIGENFHNEIVGLLSTTRYIPFIRK